MHNHSPNLHSSCMCATSGYAALLRRALHAARCAGQAARWQASPQKCATPQPEQAFSFSFSSEGPSRFVHLQQQHKHLINDVDASRGCTNKAMLTFGSLCPEDARRHMDAPPIPTLAQLIMASLFDMHRKQ